MFIAPEELPLPYEYRFFHARRPGRPCCPTTSSSRTIVFLDCGNIDRNPAHELKRPGAHILNIDHHHDNTRFGSVNWVDSDASCTAEMVWDLMRDLDVEPTPTIAEALYVGLVTDTGKFMYENTGTRAHVMAAELIDAGVEVHEIYRRLYEGIPYGKLELLARGLAHVERYDDGMLTLSHLSAARLRGDRRRGELLRGRHRPPALGRGHGGRRAGPRSSQRRQYGPAQGLAALPPTTASTSRASPAPRAAAATARRRASAPRLPWSELVEFLRGAVRDQTVSSHRRRPEDRQAGRVTSHDVVAGCPPGARRAPRRPRRHARSVRHRAAAGARGRQGDARSSAS